MQRITTKFYLQTDVPNAAMSLCLLRLTVSPYKVHRTTATAVEKKPQRSCFWGDI